MTVIINLRGDAGAGKDTFFNTAILEGNFELWALPQDLAQLLLRLRQEPTCEVSIKRYAYADALKKEVRRDYSLPESLDIDGLDENGKRLKETYMVGDKTLRQVLIEHGLNKRKESESYWTDLVVEKIKEEKPDIAVITDCRFPNESSLFRDLGFETYSVYIFNPMNEPTTNAADRASDNIPFDFIAVPSHAARAYINRPFLLFKNLKVVWKANTTPDLWFFEDRNEMRSSFFSTVFHNTVGALYEISRCMRSQPYQLHSIEVALIDLRDHFEDVYCETTEEEYKNGDTESMDDPDEQKLIIDQPDDIVVSRTVVTPGGTLTKIDSEHLEARTFSPYARNPQQFKSSPAKNEIEEVKEPRRRSIFEAIISPFQHLFGKASR